MSNQTQPTGPLNVGDVVSAGLRIYRDRFKSYYSLAFIAYLWIFVPIYGWAKLSAILGLLSRLAYGEVSENPEGVREARGEVMPRMWSFLGAGILTYLIFLGAYIVVVIVFAMLTFIIASVFQERGGATIMIVPAIISFVGVIIGFIWLVARLSLVQVTLAIEDNISASKAISRSWEITKASVGRIQLILFIAFLLTIPISLVVQIATKIIQVVFTTALPMEGNGIFSLLYVVVIVAISIANGALMVPFWQSITAVIYYDLRSRREGLGLKLKDRKS